MVRPDRTEIDPVMLEDIKSYAPDKVAGFVNSALSDMSTHYDGLMQALKADDVSFVETHIHSIKSVAAQFGAVKLAAICDDIENAAIAKDMAVCVSLIPSFEEVYQKAVAFFKEYIAA